MAAVMPGLRLDLNRRLEAVGWAAAALVADPAGLRSHLAGERRCWVLTGGSADHALPFVRAALSAESPVLALVSGARAALRDAVAPGAAAVLSARSGAAAIRAAVAAIAEGLLVWDPEDTRLGRVAPAVLSPREVEILGAVAAGMSNKRIARQFEVSPNTIKFHLQAVFDKLGVASRAEAVAVAMRRGLLSI